MARVGRFGRTRRTGSSNLTMMIAALLREQRQAEDRAAFDAWQNGGEYKGKPMTDERMLAYVKARRNGFSTDDPMWDQWNNTLIQTRFSIGEQKIGLAFKQGKVSAGAVAGWYRKQLSDIPKDSQFYRTVAGRAADWAKSAAGAARGAARAAATDAARAKVDRIKGVINDYDALVAGLTEEAQRRGLVSGNQQLVDADATALEAMFADGVVVGGKTVTFADWQEASVGVYNAMGRAIPAYKALGWDTSGLRRDRREFLNDTITKQNVIDERSAYETARDAWLEDVQSAEGDPYLISKYNQDYAKAIKGIYDGAVGRTDGLGKENAEFLGSVLNEYNAITTGKVTGPTPFGDSDANETAADALKLDMDIVGLETGTAYYGQTSFGGAFEVIQDPYSQRGFDPSTQQAVIRVNGSSRVVYLKGEEVRSGTLRDAYNQPISVDGMSEDDIAKIIRDGGRVDDAGGKVLGYTYLDPHTKKTTYGVYQADGQLRFTQENPFTTSTYSSPSGASVVLTTFEGIDATGAPIQPVAIVSNPTATSPLPVDTTLTPEEFQRSLAGQDGKIDEPWKVQEYKDFLAAYNQKQSTMYNLAGDESKPGGIGPSTTPMSPAQVVLNGALKGIQQASRDYFTQPKTTATQPLTKPNFGLPKPPELPKPPSIGQPPKPNKIPKEDQPDSLAPKPPKGKTGGNPYGMKPV